MSMALHDLEVSCATLAQETIRQLDEDGFAVIPGIMSADLLHTFRFRLDELEADEGDHGGTEVRQEHGTYRLSNLINKDPAFRVCFTHPALLAAVAHVLPDFKLSSCSSRAALPGQGLQELHSDWPDSWDGESYQVCNSIWLLDDFTEDNGATRFVPGTHLDGQHPADELADLLQPHPKETLLLAPAGTVVVFNGHVWHGGTTNRSADRRRSINAYFTRRHNGQQLQQSTFVTPEVLGQLSAAARFILDA